MSKRQKRLKRRKNVQLSAEKRRDSLRRHLIETLESRQLLTTFGVTSLADRPDANPGDGRALDVYGNTTLRSAISEANALGGSHTINLPAGNYQLSRAGRGDNTNCVGDLDIRSEITILGAGAGKTTIDGNGLDRVFHLVPDTRAALHLQNLTVTGGQTGTTIDSHGGGILNDGGTLKLDSVQLTDNVSGGRGGGAIMSLGDVAIKNSLFSGNSATGGSGGGAILQDGSNGGTLTVETSTFNNNTAEDGYGGAINMQNGALSIEASTFQANTATPHGGAIFATRAPLTISNSTFSGNRATSGHGGAIHVDPQGTSSTTITSSTFTANASGGLAGGIFSERPLVVGNTIVAGNTAGLHSADIDISLAGSFSSNGNNLVGSSEGSSITNGVNGDVVGTAVSPVNPLLGPLADNGGPTLTHAPNADSPALDAGSFKNAPDADQRGVSRPSEGDQRGQDRIDIGSVEVANQSPVAANDAYEINENKVLTVNTAAASILANDSDPDGDSLSAKLVSNPEHGNLKLNDDGTFTYTPDEGYHGKDSFTYVAHDGRYQSEIATVSFEIVCTNEPPVAVNDSYQLDMRNDVAAQTTVLANDSDPDGDNLNAVLVSSPEHGELKFNENGTFTYTPKEGYRGNDSFTYTAFDGTDSSNVATVSIEVMCSNQPPVAVNDSYSVDENSTLKTEQDSYTQQFDLRSQYGTTPYRVSNASILRESFSPFVYYWHPSQLNQWAEVVYKVDVPFSIESADSLKIGQHHPGYVSVYNGHSDANFDPNARGFFEVSLDDETWHTIYESTPEEGVKQRNEIGDILQGATSFFVRGRLNASRRLGCCGLSQFFRSAPESNSFPTIKVYGNESILSNDSDPDGDSLSAKLVSNPEHGDLKLNDDGTFTYTPDEGYHGKDSFTYTAFDGMANSNLATVNIDVVCTNEAPVAVNDSYQLDMRNDIAAQKTVLANDTDPDGDALSAVLVSSPEHGELKFNENGTFTYTPKDGYRGNDSFTYTAFDGTDSSNVATVSIEVMCSNEAPVAVNDSYSVDENSTLSSVHSDAQDNGLVAYYPFTGSAQDASQNSNHGEVKGAQLTTDRFGNTDSAYHFNGTSNSINIGPVLSRYNSMTMAAWVKPDATPGEGTVISKPRIGQSFYGSGASLKITDGKPTAGFFRETPGPFSVGAAASAITDNEWHFVTHVNDGSTVSVFVDGLHVASSPYTKAPVTSSADMYIGMEFDYPQIGNRYFSGLIDEVLIYDRPLSANEVKAAYQNGLTGKSLLANDSDPDGDSLSAKLVSNPENGDLKLNDDGSFTYTPDEDYHGKDSFTYTAFDGMANSNVATVNIEVICTNEAPVAVNDSYQLDMRNDIAAQKTVLANDSDPDGDALSAVLVSSPEHGALTFNDNGTFTYTPKDGYRGNDSFTYTAFDGTDSSNVATVSIEVMCSNEAPVAVNDSYSVDENNLLKRSNLYDDSHGWTSSNNTVHGNNYGFHAPGSSVTGSEIAHIGGRASRSASTGYYADTDLVETITFDKAFSAHGKLDVTQIHNLNADITLGFFNPSDAFDTESLARWGNNTAARLMLTEIHNDLTPRNDTLRLAIEGPGFRTDPIYLYNIVSGAERTWTLDYSPNGGTGSGRFIMTIDGPTGLGPSGRDSGTREVGESGGSIVVDLTADQRKGAGTLTAFGMQSFNHNGPNADLYADLYASKLEYTGQQDASILANDSDPDGDSLSAKLVSNPENGDLKLNDDGSFTYTPDEGFHGVDSFTYTAFDGMANSNVATVNIEVICTNDAPVAVDDRYELNTHALPDSLPTVLANDSDPDGDALSAVLVSSPEHGELKFNEDGTFSYTPEEHFHGEDSFTYTAFDGTDSSNVATVTVNVECVPIPQPTIDRISDITIDEDAGQQTVNLEGISDGTEGSLGSVAYYSFDDQTVEAGKITDLSNTGLHGTHTAQVTPGQQGRFGEAFHFDGSRDGSQVATPFKQVKPFGNSFSLSMWFNTDDIGQHQKYMIHRGTVGSDQNSIIFGYVPNTIELHANATGQDPRPLSKLVITEANTWNNVVYAYDGTNFTGYLNGEQVFNHEITFSLNSPSDLYIGSSGNFGYGNNFKGLIDEVSIWDRAVTAEEVLEFQERPITIAGGAAQPLRITATSSNPDLISNPQVNYISNAATGSLAFAPAADQSGTTTIDVNVESGGPDANLDTADDNVVTTRSFDVIVNPVNDLPTLDSINNLVSAENNPSRELIKNGSFEEGNKFFATDYTFNSSDTVGSFAFNVGTNPGNYHFAATGYGDHTSGEGLMLIGNSVNHASTTTGNSLLSPVAWSQTVDVDQNATYDLVAWTSNWVSGMNNPVLEFLINDVPIGEIANNNVATWNEFSATWKSGDATQAHIKIVEIGSRTQGPGGGNDFAVDDISFMRRVSPGTTINQDPTEQTINLTGITAGGGEDQPLRVTATSNNTDLVPDPAVHYTSAETTGSLDLTTIDGQSGSAIITVSVEDGGLDADLSTTEDNATYSLQFEVVVTAAPNSDPTSGLLVHLGLNADTIDQSGNDYHGINHGSEPTDGIRQMENTAMLFDRNGAIPPAGDFNNNFAGDWVDLSSHNLDDKIENTLTVSFWMNFDHYPKYGEYGNKSIMNILRQDRVVAIYVDGRSKPGDSIGFMVGNATGSKPWNPDIRIQENSDGPFADSQWHHYAYTVSATEQNVYVDGKLVGTRDTGATIGSNNYGMGIGSHLDGGLDEFRIYDRDLSSSEVLTLYEMENSYQRPTLDAIADVTIAENDGQQKVTMAGIGDGRSDLDADQSQPLRVTASSSNPDLIAPPSVDYTSAQSTAILDFTPTANNHGSSTITVTIEAGGLDGDLSTTADNASYSREFEIVVVAAPKSDPTAVNDLFQVEGDEQAVELDVLENDSNAPDANDLLQITQVSSPSEGGTVSIDVGSDQLLYQPAEDFSGQETFTYMIVNNHGRKAVATVTIDVTQAQIFNGAVDDTFVNISQDIEDFTSLDVMKNDMLALDDMIQLISVESPSNGTTMIDEMGETVLYKPAAGFFGTDQFSYMVRDLDGTQHQAQVTVQIVPTEPITKWASFTTVAMDQETGEIITEIPADESFDLVTFVQDVRPFMYDSEAGVFAAYMDVLYTADTVQLEAEPVIEFSSFFSNVHSGDTSKLGVIDEVGGMQAGLSPLGNQPIELFRITFAGFNPGTAVFTTDPADLMPENSPLIFQPPTELGPDKLHLTETIVEITEPDPSRFLDVNDDDAVTPMDALQVINDLNYNGSRPVDDGPEGPEGEVTRGNQPRASSLDVNKDNYVSPLDALAIINYLNIQSRASAIGGEGESVDSAIADQLFTATVQPSDTTATSPSQQAAPTLVQQELASIDLNGNRQSDHSQQHHRINDVALADLLDEDDRSLESLLDQVADGMEG